MIVPFIYAATASSVIIVRVSFQSNYDLERGSSWRLMLKMPLESGPHDEWEREIRSDGIPGATKRKHFEDIFVPRMKTSRSFNMRLFFHSFGFPFPSFPAPNMTHSPHFHRSYFHSAVSVHSF